MKPGSILFAVFAACALWLAGLPAAWCAEPAAARVTVLSGEARAGGRALKMDDTVAEGEEIVTGVGGRVTLEFTDRSVVRVRTDSRLRIEAHRGSGAPAEFETRLRLDSGAVEAIVPARGAPGFGIASPSGTLVTRDAEFRVRARADAMLVEVLAGTVVVAGKAGGEVAVGPGLGTRVSPAGAPLAPVKLLEAADISGVAAAQHKPMAELRFAPLAGAARYRIVVAASRDPGEPIFDSRPRRPDMRLVELQDGEYIYSVRGVDALGLEGLEARGRFLQKAQPAPPAAQAPAPDALLQPGNVAFSWEAAGEEVAYRFQLAADEAFAALLVDRSGLAALEFEVEKLQAGRYFWRLASLRAGGDQGPFGDSQAFTLQASAPRTQ